LVDLSIGGYQEDVCMKMAWNRKNRYSELTHLGISFPALPGLVLGSFASTGGFDLTISSFLTGAGHH